MKEIELLKTIFKDSPDILEPLNEIDKEIEELKAEIKELNDDNVWWTNRFKAVERDNKRLNNIIKEVREIINQPMINYSSCIKALDEIEIVLDKENK